MPEQSKMEISLFSGMTILWNGTPILEHSARLNKPLELLALLLLRGDKKLTNEQLMDGLWESDEIENPAGALKNAAYSLRKFLQKADKEKRFIITERALHLEPGNLRHHRCVEFEQEARLADQPGTPAEERIPHARRALKLYTGDLLPSLSMQQWSSISSYLRQTYLRTVKNLAATLCERGGREDLEETLDICNRAALLEPLHEELYRYIFNTMRRLDMKQAVLSYYPVISNLFYDELGERLSPELRDIYLWASQGANQMKENLRQIQQDLGEITRDARPIHGAYYCEYEMFKSVYQMVARSAARSNSHVLLILVTFEGKNGQTVAKQEIVDAMARGKEVIRESLRKGDVFSRYSRNQYILMLTVTSPADSVVVENRIKDAFKEVRLSAKIELRMKAQELDPIV
ncbi:MAG: BTAD domain-containing putative transcriptional regulator [Ruthenibacterium lactatiformans]